MKNIFIILSCLAILGCTSTNNRTTASRPINFADVPIETLERAAFSAKERLSGGGTDRSDVSILYNKAFSEGLWKGINNPAISFKYNPYQGTAYDPLMNVVWNIGWTTGYELGQSLVAYYLKEEYGINIRGHIFENIEAEIKKMR